MENKIIWEVVENVLDDWYYAYCPGHQAGLMHIVDDCFIGFNWDDDKITLFNLYDCDFKQFDNGAYSTEGLKEWTYKTPQSFEELIDILHKHELLYVDENPEMDKIELIKLYNKYYNIPYTPFKLPLIYNK